MKKQTWRVDDICIVGIGCVLPDANNPQEFWANVAEGACAIRALPEERWSSDLYMSADKKEADKTYSNSAGFVEHAQVERLAETLGMDRGTSNRLQIMAMEAATQALGCLCEGSLGRTNGNAAVALGCMEMDEALTMEKLYEREQRSLERYIEEHALQGKGILEGIARRCNNGSMPEEAKIGSVLTTSVVQMIKQRFGLRGEGMLTDAACASSLVAVDMGMRVLRNREADFAVVGGIESNLAPDTFVLFSKVGALSQGRCHPFDIGADGLSQGEGAVVFVLQRMEDAVRDGNRIYGVLRSVGSSSDGRSSSLFSPSVDGQVLAYERAYEGLDRSTVDYVECHGTGTRIGDKIEVAALNQFFGNKKMPIGSVKALVGHTKGAAGAAGLLKCVMALQQRVVPPSPYLERFIGKTDDSVFVNSEIIDLSQQQKPIRFGVSSFGFGNVNYHVVLDEYREGSDMVERDRVVSSEPIVVIGESMVMPDAIDADKIARAYRMPRQSVPHTDVLQLQGLLAVSAALEGSNINIDALDKNEVGVIAASCLGLRSATDLAERVRHFEFRRALDFLDDDTVDIMIRHKEKFTAVSEDTGPGVLNNVIAGRVCNVFDFKGGGYNIDCDFSASFAALRAAARNLRERPGIVVLLYADEKLNEQKNGVDREAMHCMVLTTLDYAKRNDHPIRKVIKQVDFYDEQ